MNLIKTNGILYKKGIQGRVFYLASTNEWLRSSDQQEWLDVFQLARHLLTCFITRNKSIAKDLGWTLLRAARAVAFLKRCDLLHLNKKGDIQPTALLLKSISE